MIQPVNYTDALSLDVAYQRFEEVSREYDIVRGRYTGIFSRFRRNIRQPDLSTLVQCTGALLPLSTQASVQEEASQRQDGEALTYRIGQLTQDILLFSSRFKNSGVRVV